MLLWSIQTATVSAYANFLLAFAGASCLLGVPFSLRLEPRSRAIAIASGIGLLMSGVVLASLASPGRNSVVNLVKFDQFETITGGLCGVLAALAATAVEPGRLARRLGYAVSLAVVGFCAFMINKDTISTSIQRFFRSVDQTTPGVATVRVGGRVRVEPYAKLDLEPICFTRGPDGALYVGGLRNLINYDGVIVRLARDSPGDPVRSTVVAEHLVRPHGLAFHDGHLYVARTGLATVTEGDRIRYRPCGAVTRLTDVDGDRKFDLYRDILTDLPSFGLHQVSGITFKDNYLYVTVGAGSDHGPVIEPFEGTILRSRPDGSGLTVFARGVRNPYDIIVGPEGELFCTDNDADELNRGDALYHVREGSHMGFPYTQVLGAPRINGVSPPLFLPPPGRSEVLEGLAYAPPGGLPRGFDDCLYVASVGHGSIKRLRLRRGKDGDGFEVEPLEDLTGFAYPLDLVIVPEERAIYVLCSYGRRTIERVVIE